MTKKIKMGPVWYYAGYLGDSNEWKIAELKQHNGEPALHFFGVPEPLILVAGKHAGVMLSLKAVDRPKTLKNDIPF